MKRYRWCYASVAAAAVLLLSVPGGGSGALRAGGTASIMGTWRYAYAGQVQVIAVSGGELVETITGTGMRPGGMVMRKKVAAIGPGPASHAGTIVTGPAENLMKPYEVYHWYELGEGRVKFYIAGKQFDTVAEAAGSRGNPEQAHLFQRIR